MNISDIIPMDADRLFLVDPECYIIYTGENPGDDKPFIRIGNWPGLFPAVIPQIENIIITDRMTGNPFFEQFDVDLKYISSNKYIGTMSTVRRYIDFQKSFGIDLLKAGFIDIEKDIPELSGERQFAGKNQFIGIFYHDGNFRTVHENKTILNMENITQSYPDYRGIHDLIAKNAAKTKAYDGCGMVIVDTHPLFYSGGIFTSYLFPGKYLSAFSELAINPENISHVIYPSDDFMPMARFLKWRAGKDSVLTVFSEKTGLLGGMKKLLPGFPLTIRSISRFSIETEGTVIRNVENTKNLLITYCGQKPEKKELHCACVFEKEGLPAIIKQKPDVIFMAMGIYDKSALILKSYPSPVVLFEDGNTHLKKIYLPDCVVMKPNIRYEMLKADDINSFPRVCDFKQYIEGDLDLPKIDALDALMLECEKKHDQDELYSAFNLLSYARVAYHSTTDRNLSSKIRSLLEKHHARLTEKIGSTADFQVKITLVYYHGGIYEFIERISEQNSFLLPDDADFLGDVNETAIDSGVLKLYKRIKADRVRLLRLLDFLNSQKSAAPVALQSADMKKNPAAHAALRHQKNSFSGETGHGRAPESGETGLSHSEDEKSHGISGAADEEFSGTPYPAAAARTKSRSAGTAEKNTREALSFPEKAEEKKSADFRPDMIIRKLKTYAGRNILIPACLVITAALLGAAYLNQDRIWNLPFDKKPGTEMEQPSGKNEKTAQGGLETRLSDKSRPIHSDISDTEIFYYVNKIAIRNGYAAIPYSYRGKNPDWIFPANAITMPDGERITVQKGNTIWHIARKKLARLKQIEKR